MRKNVLRTGVLAVIGVLAMTGVAAAIVLRAGSLEVVGEGGFTPTTLPKHETAPITLHGEGKIGTTDGSLPPILNTLTVWFDKHGAVVTKGLPYCTKGKLAATTTATARKVCAGSIVGEGHGTALIAFPEQRPFKASSPITLFNAAPHDGNPTVLAHAYLSVPAPTTYIVPIEIQKVQQRPVRVPHRSAHPEDRRRRRDPARREPDDRQKMVLQGAAAELRERQLPERQAAGESRNRIHRLDETEWGHPQTLSGVRLRRRTGSPPRSRWSSCSPAPPPPSRSPPRSATSRSRATAEFEPRAFPAHGALPATLGERRADQLRRTAPSPRR